MGQPISVLALLIGRKHMRKNERFFGYHVNHTALSVKSRAYCDAQE